MPIFPGHFPDIVHVPIFYTKVTGRPLLVIASLVTSCHDAYRRVYMAKSCRFLL